MIDIKKILIPTDFSETSQAATQYAVELAKKFGAQLHLLHVIEDPVVYMPMFESYALPPKEDFENFAKTRLDNWILDEDKAGLEISTHWVHGNPFVDILKYAKREEIDLIVVGTHGRSFTAHLLLGSVAEKVVRKASCPVLTVRPKGHQFIHPTSDDE
ncbi:universal stress protein [Gimesia maris]|uniref:Universal stress protein n=1 Tax=Gimesia maris TaxID=122 RepID=A0ABX5YMQ4_9PLAN|nr:universal stress protein [Gimesia maris]EDL59028.1 universal stress protein family [Gimesia maris DSM 8797]QDU14910.1 Putative universal stress protein [Gimesia maris]QEG16924.1 Putative universal stress protein [Gimesia maris]QGQ29945.1 universal stress protein [Gimesia maris]|tara:strand:- start:343697 stop:344170 length:474 start_codon:yes stop_codon:yes gene_type:complete